jgi:hypothetical protein
MSPINLKESIWARVRSECSAEIHACLLAIKEHRDLIEEYTRRSLLPGQAEALLKKLSDDPLQDPTAERLEAHALILSKLRAVKENTTVQLNAKRAANIKFMEAEPAMVALEAAATASLDRQTAELVEAERVFFAGYGLPPEPTAVSRLAASLKEAIHNHSFTNGKAQVTGMGGGAGNYVPRLDISSLRMLFMDEA